MVVDTRLVVGNQVKAKATHVTSDAECARRYGADFREKWLTGVVVDIVVDSNNKTKRKLKKVVADYKLSEGIIKRKKIALQSIKAVEEQVAPSVPVTAIAAAVVLTPGNACTIRSTSPRRQILTEQVPVATDTIVPVALQFGDLSVAAEQITESQATTSPSGTTGTPTVLSPCDEPQNNQQQEEKTPAAKAHELDWYVDNPSTMIPINGPVYTRKWAVRVSTGENWVKG